MKKFLSFAFSRMPLALHSTPSVSTQGDKAVRPWIEDYMNASSDMDAVWYYERRRWRAQKVQAGTLPRHSGLDALLLGRHPGVPHA